jgi:hypothetical protein
LERGLGTLSARARYATSQTAIVKNYLLAYDVIAKAPPAQAQPVLPFALGNAFKLENVVTTAAIVRICPKNHEGFRIGIHQIRVTSGEPAEQSFKAGSGPDNKRRRHDF